MTTTPAVRLPQFITDGGIATHLIFNLGVELPHFSAFPLNDSAAGREVIRSYYRDYLPVARAACRNFLFAPAFTQPGRSTLATTGPKGTVRMLDFDFGEPSLF